MLKKKNRLTTEEFQKVFKNGKKISSTFFLIIILPINDSKKISVAISKKIEKTAIDRTLSRRKIYTIIKENFSEISNNIKIIVLITKKINHKKKPDIQKELLGLFKKANIIK